MSPTYRPLLVFLATLYLWLPSLRSEAQSREPMHKKMAERNLQEGEALLEHELYFEATQFFEKATKLDPENLAATYQLAECHRLTFQYEQAEKGYGKTVYAQSADYPLALFYYALMQKMNGKYAESANNFAAFIGKADLIRLASPPGIVARARTEMAGCEMARKQETLLRRNYEHRILPAPLNTPSHEYAPLTAGWDSLLVITSTRPGAKGRQQDSKLGQALSDFYRFESPDSLQTWQPGSRGDQLEKINTKWGEGSGSFNRTFDRFYFTSCQQAEARCEIFVTQLKNGKWQEPVKLNPNINEPGYDSRHPALSPGGDTLFFASNRPKGAGMNDLWMSTTAGGDFWGPAINLGNSINTPLNELSPFFDEQEKVLFFASDGHQSLGGLDMFIAKKQANRTWKVTNMGPPFNSNRDDAFLTLGKVKGYMASNRPGGVGNFDIYTFSLMSNETAIASLNRSKGTHSPDLAYLRDYKLDYFPKEDQLRIDRLVSQKKTEQLYQIDLLLTKEEDAFYQQLSNQEKKTLDLAASHLFEQMDLPEQQRSKTRDEQLFQLAPPNEQARLNRMAEAHRQASVSRTSLPYSDEDARYYEGLSLPEKKLLDGILAARLRNPGSNNGPAVAALPEQDQFKYEKLPLSEKSRIDRIAAARLARMLGNETTRLSEEDEQFYAALTPEEKAAFDRLVNAKMAEMLAQQKGLRPADFDYAHLPLEDQQRINRIAAARRAALLNNQPVQLSQEDLLYYNQLSKAEKTKFDQWVEVKMTQLAIQESKNPFEGFNYELLPLEERKRIDRIVAARRAALQNNQPVQLSQEDQRYYDQLSDQDKQQIDRMVASQSPSSLVRVKTGPPRIAPKISGDQPPEAALHTFQTGNFKSISLKGQVLQADTALPVKGLEVLLVNEAGVPEKWTTTDARGRFQYIRLSPDKQYSIRVNEPPVRLTQPSGYRIKDLQMLGYEEKVSDIRHEPIYFDFNRYAIRPEAQKVLEALIALCRANPDMQIEINAFTDPLGSKEYNLELSRKRGREVQHYLVEHGVNPNALVMRYQGEERVRYGTNQAAGHQANRRVEFILKGAPTGYQSHVYTYIMQAKSTVSSLAKLFGMTVQELKALNDFTSDTVDAYRPVRVKNHQKVTPALLLRPDQGKTVRQK